MESVPDCIILNILKQNHVLVNDLNLTFLAFSRFLKEQVCHTFPVFGHWVDLPETVHQVGTMFM